MDLPEFKVQETKMFNNLTRSLVVTKRTVS
ncbi:hypothetical protein EV146_11474 [Mesobacillus foraminis]|uniref:Uncharacterized protein n=1 Tax=Mesobacillus foraminis TaxID=279826 RepID=A0A4R2B339_9BACI|nr:hypothetical protein EV146_11474 [Mesobacillus foraminis]